MKDQSKTKQVLIQELSLLRQKIAELEQSESERKRAEEAPRESESKYRNLINEAWDAIFVIDSTGKILLVNEQAYQMLGYTEEELIRLNVADTYLVEERAIAAQRIATVKRGDHSRYERSMVRKDGTIFPVEVAIGMLPNGMIQGIVRNITDRKRTEEALRVSEERFRRLSEAAFEAIAIHETGVLLNANDQFFKMLGYEPGEVLGKQVMPMTVALEAREFMTNKIATDDLLPYESIGLRKDGTRFPMEISARQMEYKGRNVRVGVIRDITERRQAEEQLRLKTENLEEVNTALKVLLRQLEESKTELIGTMLSSIRELVLPHIHKLKDSSPSAYYISLLDIVETNLNNIASSFLHQLKFKYYNLTPREIEVATLVKEGKSVKEIAALLNISISTVQFHRISLREKLGLKDRKSNLRSYLLSLH